MDLILSKILFPNYINFPITKLSVATQTTTSNFNSNNFFSFKYLAITLIFLTHNHTGVSFLINFECLKTVDFMNEVGSFSYRTLLSMHFKRSYTDPYNREISIPQLSIYRQNNNILNTPRKFHIV